MGRKGARVTAPRKEGASEPQRSLKEAHRPLRCPVCGSSRVSTGEKGYRCGRCGYVNAPHE
ncbi:MAG: hypothetical protein JRN39_06625 [Nitrososphaerota archaeon]|nr:hypothetical protein [Nitrososphaerota archaeon]